MVQSEKVRSAAAFAKQSHDGQVDKAGEPYYGHVSRVANLVSQVPGFAALSPDEQVSVVAAAYLHDVVEDCDVSAEQLAAQGFSEDTVETVKLVSKNVDPCSFDEYHARVASHKFARLVKLADLADNSNKARQKALADLGIYFNPNKYPNALRIVGLSDEESVWFESVL